MGRPWTAESTKRYECMFLTDRPPESWIILVRFSEAPCLLDRLLGYPTENWSCICMSVCPLWVGARAVWLRPFRPRPSNQRERRPTEDACTEVVDDEQRRCWSS